MAEATTDHDTIRRWVERRGGCPAHVKRRGRVGDPGILRIDFPGFSGKQSLEKIGWDQFFRWFDKNELAFVYEDKTREGKQSRFNKLVGRDTVAARARGPRKASRHRRAKPAGRARTASTRTAARGAGSGRGTRRPTRAVKAPARAGSAGGRRRSAASR